jgi:hypothetical protein
MDSLEIISLPDEELEKILLTVDGKGTTVKKLALDEIVKRTVRRTLNEKLDSYFNSDIVD